MNECRWGAGRTFTIFLGLRADKDGVDIECKDVKSFSSGHNPRNRGSYVTLIDNQKKLFIYFSPGLKGHFYLFLEICQIKGFYDIEICCNRFHIFLKGVISGAKHNR